MFDELFASLFWLRLSKGHSLNDCWFFSIRGIWVGDPRRLVTDYPTYQQIGKVSFLPHRAAYELTYGPIPEGFVVRHRCANGGCCNPDHLILGTRHENSLDIKVRNRMCIKKGELATYEDFPDLC